MDELLEIWHGYEPARCAKVAGLFLVSVSGLMLPATDGNIVASIEEACAARDWFVNIVEDTEGTDGGYHATIWQETPERTWTEREHGATEALAIVPAYTEALQTAGIV